MSIVKTKKIKKSYGSLAVLKDISFSLERGQKAALVGLNGTGKTTLLRIIAGLEEADSGKLELAKGTRIGYLPQDFNSDSVLSSGQKTKAALLKILEQGADLLLLDEPTNNLDLPSLVWLENFLQQSEAAGIVVSHDRRFLDRVVNKILEIDWRTKELTITNGTYSDYLKRAVKALARQKADYRLQQEEIERLTARAREKRQEAESGRSWQGQSDSDKLLRGFKRDRAKSSARTAKAMMTRIEHLEKVEKPAEREPLTIKLAADTRAGVRDIYLKDLIVGYDNFRLSPVSLDLLYGKRIGIVGLNGAGKSALLKTLTGALAPISGKVEIGAGVRIGNMMQEHESLPREEAVLEFLKTKANLTETAAYHQLVKFGFQPDQVKQIIGELSRGARARLLLAYFSVLAVNVLVLDEPTNHLDLEALAALEETLSTYTGTVILVSHDRYFLGQARLDDIYVLADGKLTLMPDDQRQLLL
jgi:ATP-binding cassette subfamily F protein 3